MGPGRTPGSGSLTPGRQSLLILSHSSRGEIGEVPSVHEPGDYAEALGGACSGERVLVGRGWADHSGPFPVRPSGGLQHRARGAGFSLSRVRSPSGVDNTDPSRAQIITGERWDYVPAGSGRGERFRGSVSLGFESSRLCEG